MIKRQLLAYIVVGLATTFLDVGTLATLLHLGVHYAVATTIAFVAALAFNYLAHASVTFEAAHSFASIQRYGVILGVNYLLTLAMVAASNAWLATPMIGKLASIPVVAAIGFLSGRYWVFREKKETGLTRRSDGEAAR